MMHQHQKTFHASLDYLYDMLDFVYAFAIQRGFEASISNKIKLAVEEVLVNIIKYGFLDQSKENTLDAIEISCEALTSAPGLKISIKDQGSPFNPMQELIKMKEKHKKTLNQGIEERQLGGYGILIYINLMDEVAYSRTQQGNVLFLVKYL